MECLRMRLETREAKLDQVIQEAQSGYGFLAGHPRLAAELAESEKLKGRAFIKAVHELTAIVPEGREVATRGKANDRGDCDNLGQGEPKA